MTSDATRRRVLIIGAGISGPVAAMFLQRAGWEAVLYEARAGVETEEGAFLNLAPNGVNVLGLLGIDIERAADGVPATGITIFNASGKELGAIDSRDDEARFGARGVVLKRANLHRALLSAATAAGVPIQVGKRLSGIEQLADAVVATFADGTTAAGDVLIGCDGIHSRTRQLILPAAPKPVYTGIVDCGGFVRPTPPVPPTPAMQMVFGDNAFVGYLARPDGEVYWFCNLAWDQEPARGELDAISSAEWARRLGGLLADEPEPIPRIVAATTGEIGKWPVYDIPSLPTWHQGRVCLIGDAAHATSPHVGQGASTALEDAAELARCLRDIVNPSQAFAVFQGIRKARVEKLVARARRTGSQKAVTNPAQAWLRDRMLGMFLRFGRRSNDWIYAYRVSWQEPVTS
ncbi:MAG: FAD-dependent monooxygenase [Chloroflexota bacterium]|nr:FAD-dependent monooxygenase [Chloroflexota bacterium]